jgi:hypothetical protein
MNMFSMFNERKTQLQKQETIDIKLMELSKKCPATVSDYLLLQRKITREQQYKIINTNFLYIYDEMQKQLNVNQVIMNKFLNINMNCSELKKII